jgi:hypothetical protein
MFFGASLSTRLGAGAVEVSPTFKVLMITGVLVIGGLVTYRPFWFVAATTALVPLESFLVALLAKAHLGDLALFVLQLSIEASIYYALALVVLSQLIAKQILRRTPVDTPLLLILAVVSLTIAVNDAPLVGSLMNLRSALRYVAVFYLVVNIGLTRRQVNTLLGVILISGAVQVLTGLVQWEAGYGLKVFMLPHTVDIDIAGKTRNFAIVQRGREIGSVFGTLGDTLYYGLFLLVVLAVALPKFCRWRAWHAADVVALALATAYSYSRAAVIVAGLTLASFAGGWLGARRVAAACCAVAALGVVVLAGSMALETNSGTYHHPRQGRRSILYNMTNIFSGDYLERSKRQRLGAVLGVAPTALMNAPVLGYGPDQRHTIRQLNREPRTRLYKSLTKEGFEDVYWVALLCYTGLAGVFAVLWLGARLAWTCAAVARGARGDPTVRWAGLAGLCIVLQAAVLMWFNRVPEIRSFSFYFWLLPALAYTAWAAQHTADGAATEPTPPGHEPI